MAGDIARVDTMTEADFAVTLAPLFEGAPRFLARLAGARPFRSWDALFERAAEIARSMPEDEQIELINAHPRLGAPPASVSEASFREQGYDRDTETVIAELARLNGEYEDRFGFRYCVFVAGRSRPELVPLLERALTADRASEIQRALRDVIDIARDRHRARQRAAEGAA